MQTLMSIEVHFFDTTTNCQKVFQKKCIPVFNKDNPIHSKNQQVLYTETQKNWLKNLCISTFIFTPATWLNEVFEFLVFEFIETFLSLILWLAYRLVLVWQAPGNEHISEFRFFSWLSPNIKN